MKPTRWQRFLCWLGIHPWQYFIWPGNQKRGRFCPRCHRIQVLHICRTFGDEWWEDWL